MSFDWESGAKTAIIGGVGLASSGAGVVAKVLITVFWPDNKGLWDTIRQQIEALVDGKIDDLVYSTAKGHLTGWKALVENYAKAISNNAGGEAIRGEFRAANDAFIKDINEFQTEGHELRLLPFFAQAANLHLSLLRDQAIHGAEWGMTDGDRRTHLDSLKSRIASYAEYVSKTIAAGEARVRAATGANSHRCEPFRSVNRYRREVILVAQDFADMWPYFDPTVHPPSPDLKIWPTREIYGDPAGTCDNSGDIHLRPAPAKPIRGLVAWADQDRIFGLDVVYPAGGGPDGASRTGRMGAASGGSELPPYGGKIPVGDGRTIMDAEILSGDVLEGLVVRFRDGSSRRFGKAGPGVATGFANHVVSSLHVNGQSNFYRCADSLVIGFMFDPKAMASTDILQRLYVGSPRPVSIESLIQATQAPFAPAAIAELAATEDWAGQRERHWRELAMS